jgi:ribosomal protein S18 acetylase RimI-like enzyme
MWAAQAAADPRMSASPMAEIVVCRSMEEHLACDRSEVLVADDGGRVVGYALGTILENPPVVPDQFYGYVSDVAVTATARRSGVGTRLTDAMHAWFRSRRLPYAQVQVAARSEGGRAFWRRAGYSAFVEQMRMEL